MQYTENYSLRKPQAAETASYQDLNYNSDKIDGIMADNRQISLSMYVSGNTYNTGDLVGYENPSTHRIRVYRCLVDNVTGTWDSTKWTLTNLADEILDAKASGGTEVEANPTGTASDTLNTVRIDNVIYAVGGDSANQNIADAFSELQTYAVGDYCIYESILYKCTTAVQTAGAWDSTKWASCVVTDEMGSGGGGGSSTLAGLDDVSLTTPTQGQALVYDGNDWVNGKGGSDLIINAQIYSTEERQIGVYTDGRPLYQKTIDIGQLTNSSTKTVAHNIANLDLTGIAKADGVIYNQGGYAMSLPRVHDSGITNQIFYEITTTNIVIYNRGLSTANTFTQGTVTIQYTKTTDTPGSGSYQAYGLAPVIFSTEEREIGVWHDGKPLYRKTYTFSTPIIIPYSGTAVETPIDSSDIDVIVYASAIHADGTNYDGIITDPTKSNHTRVGMQTGRNGANATASVIVLEYTKLSDTAGSGTWTPSGVPAVHYSTDEQVVGTIQGTTLYEKLVTTGGSVPTGATLILRMALSNGYDVIQYTKSSS